MRYITSSIIFGCIRPCGFCPHLRHLQDDKPMRFATLFGDKPMFIWQRNALASRSVKSRKLFYTIYTCSWTWLIIVYNTVYTHFCDYMYPQYIYIYWLAAQLFNVRYRHLVTNMNIICYSVYTDWWFQPIWINPSYWGSSSQIWLNKYLKPPSICVHSSELRSDINWTARI